jgi:hypothetical protein
MGNTWTGSGSIVSMGMGGVLSVFDPREGAGPVKMIHVRFPFFFEGKLEESGALAIWELNTNQVVIATAANIPIIRALKRP